LTQYISPDDEHDVLETCRELKIKINTQKEICKLRWSFTKSFQKIFTKTDVPFTNFKIEYSVCVSDSCNLWLFPLVFPTLYTVFI